MNGEREARAAKPSRYDPLIGELVYREGGEGEGDGELEGRDADGRGDLDEGDVAEDDLDDDYADESDGEPYSSFHFVGFALLAPYRNSDEGRDVEN